MYILAIDTSCDETSAAVTNGITILSNIIWSQASSHAKFGGVMPSLAQRMHKERIDFVIEKALKTAFPKKSTRDFRNLHKSKNRTADIGSLISKIDAIAVTIGPGLSIALGVGVDKAKELSTKFNKPLIPVNHIEAHLLSPFARPGKIHKDFTSNSRADNNSNQSIPNIKFPAYGLVVSGGNTIFVYIKDIGDYKILAQTVDDALGEALDKGARMIGLGYPGGAVLEKMSRLKTKTGRPFSLPIPLIGQEKRMIFSYSGLKTSFYRLLESNKRKYADFPKKEDIYNLSYAYQDAAFKHVERILNFYFSGNNSILDNFLLGGGVAANIDLRKRLRSLGEKFGFKIHIPYTKKLYGDNAGMVGVCAFLKISNIVNLPKDFNDVKPIDRNPKLKLTDN